MGISQSERLIVAIYYCFLGVFGLLANVSLIIALYRLKEYRKRPSTSYLFSILLASVLASLFQIPYFAHNILADLPPPSPNAYDIECRISIFVMYSISTVKIFLLTALSIDRCLAVTYPYVYNNYATRATTCMANAFFWILPIPLLTPLSALDNGCEYQGMIGSSCGVKWSHINRNYLLTILVVGYIIPCTVVAVTNIKVFMIARKQKRVIASEAKRFSTRHDALQRDMVEEGPFEEESEPTTENAQIVTRVKYLANDLKETEFPEASPTLQKANYSASNETGPNDLTGATSKKHNMNSQSKPAYSTCKVFADPLTDNCPTCFKNTPRSETKVDRARKPFTVTVEENGRSQNRFGKTSTLKQAGPWPSRRKLLQRNDFGLIASTLMLAVAFLATWTPFVISRAFEAFVDVLDTRSTLYPAAVTLLDVVLNPLIILGTRAKLRKDYKNTIFSFSRA